MLIPTVTVLIDTYNHERFIEEAIVSALEQDFPRGEMEILVVDDGSTDRTAEIVRKFRPQVRLIQKTNGGQASAFNTGIPETQGEIVAFLDGDDWWAKEKLSTVADYLAARPHIGIVGHGIYEFDSDTGIHSPRDCATVNTSIPAAQCRHPAGSASKCGGPGDDRNNRRELWPYLRYGRHSSRRRPSPRLSGRASKPIRLSAITTTLISRGTRRR